MRFIDAFTPETMTPDRMGLLTDVQLCEYEVSQLRTQLLQRLKSLSGDDLVNAVADLHYDLELLTGAIGRVLETFPEPDQCCSPSLIESASDVACSSFRIAKAIWSLSR